MKRDNDMRVFCIYKENVWLRKLGIFTNKTTATEQIKLHEIPNCEYTIREMDMVLNSPAIDLKKLESGLQESTYNILEYLKFREHNKKLGEKFFSELKKFWIYLLPIRFETKEALRLGEKLGIARRTAFYALKQAWTMDNPILWKISKGQYQKTREISSVLSNMLKASCIVMDKK